MKRILLALPVIAMALHLPLIATDANPDNLFVGKWKLNPAKSKLAEDTVRLEAVPGGYKRTEGKLSYVIKTDGKEYPLPVSGGTVSLRKTGEGTWEFQYGINGQPMGVETWTLTEDGKTANIRWKGTTASGKAFDDQAVRTRPASSHDLPGAWTATKVELSSPTEFEIRPSGQNGETVIVPASEITYALKLDGRDYPVLGPRVPKGATTMVKVAGPRSREIVDKVNGKVVSRIKADLSPDGSTMTQVANYIDSDKPFTLVYDRQ